MWPPVPFSVEIRTRWVPQFYTAAVAASSPPPPHRAYGHSCKSGKDFTIYCYCRLCNSDLHIQENTHVISFKTSPSRSLSSSLLFVKYSYCRKFPDFQALPYIRPVLASLPTLCVSLFSPSAPFTPPPPSLRPVPSWSSPSGTSCQGQDCTLFYTNKILWGKYTASCGS